MYSLTEFRYFSSKVYANLIIFKCIQNIPYYLGICDGHERQQPAAIWLSILCKSFYFVKIKHFISKFKKFVSYVFLIFIWTTEFNNKGKSNFRASGNLSNCSTYIFQKVNTMFAFFQVTNGALCKVSCVSWKLKTKITRNFNHNWQVASWKNISTCLKLFFWLY